MSQSFIYILIGLLSAVFSGVAYTNISILNRTDHTVVIMLYFSAITLISVGPYSIIHTEHLFSPKSYLVLLGLGIASYITQYYITKAYQATSAILIAQAYYLTLVLASIIGYFLWDESITNKMIIGTLLILTGNIFVTVKR